MILFVYKIYYFSQKKHHRIGGVFCLFYYSAGVSAGSSAGVSAGAGSSFFAFLFKMKKVTETAATARTNVSITERTITVGIFELFPN